ncbi:XRN 5'-3' exonuclease N-terminus-domain-containing protein [Mycena sanguinolenta]|nr:XRN 5'-3' exonuclease N-terminus-domain-containing protein [Mycena sanguinolenta]
MGVPALFRWLSKKYPKIIYPVEEEEDIKVPAQDGSIVSIPVNMSMPNPNGKEFDNLYLDMNGIVHPCTHPEGRPAPETEEEMMLEIFKYTERVVNMVRPRKLLFMAIDGVAPRAKMNQQRSRRFRAAQDAKDKEAERAESLLLWRAMGKEVTEEDKQSWDTNAITPGTPFMELLAVSLRYWVVEKLNTDPGWKNIQVLISDAGVPGEGEHKIMDFIRRQRTNPGHDPNTRHVIYGLDADLIMLGIATHEPNFWVLREDVFADGNSTACRKCGEEGHYAAQCTATTLVKVKQKEPGEKKPFIFLDVAILREYLEVELDVPQALFFNFEQAIDDWVLLIFFVGNDFLPHLPSLEIREGAIDTLLRIWKQELPRMGGYLTNHGDIVLERAQIILEGLAQREDDIFRRRREAEDRQDQNAKRRKLEEKKDIRPSSSLALTTAPTAPTPPSGPPVHHPLPPRPDFAANADSMGFGAPASHVPIAAQALAGSNRDVVANRRAIRMANLSAAEMLKAELSGAVPVKPNLSLPAKPATSAPGTDTFMSPPPPPDSSSSLSNGTLDHDEGVPGFGNHHAITTSDPSDDHNDSTASVEPMPVNVADGDVVTDEPMNGDVTTDTIDTSMNSDDEAVGLKRKLSDMENVGDETIADDEEDDAPPDVSVRLKVNSDGTVDQEDTVKLWEPGYKDRYYKQKFPDHADDPDLRKKITTAYIEGLAWVLHYYYQGTASWQWFYPYHFAPFAADFTDVKDMKIVFNIGTPFKPFEQLMGVFPPESRSHIPSVFHPLMMDKRSPLRGASTKADGTPTDDFYPTEFMIDMNGKKMVWQGVALLSFIDQDVLLNSMAKPLEFLPEDERPKVDLHAELSAPGPNDPPYTIYLNEGERRRNVWGHNNLFACNEHPVYPFYEQLYAKRKSQDPAPLDVKLSAGISGSVSRDPTCIPGSTYYSPLSEKPDIRNDKSLSVIYYFPKQVTPHRSVLLKGVTKPRRILNPGDLETVRRGGRGRGGGRGGHHGGSDRGGRNDPFHSRPNNYGGQGGGQGGGYQNSYGNNDRGRGNDRGYRGGNNNNNSYHHQQQQQPYHPPRQPYPQQQQQQQYGGQQQQYGGYNHTPPPQNNYGGYGGNRGGPPPRGGPPQNYNSYGQQGQGGYGANNYGMYGAPPPAPAYGGGYGGQGQGQAYGYPESQGGYPPPNGSGYNGNNRGGYNNNARGRGRGW